MLKKVMIVSLIALAIGGCKKKQEVVQPATNSDTVQPVITLIGSNDDTVSLNATYLESGATAQDNVDGDISSSIIVSGSVNVNLVGTYSKYYDVSDVAGNNAARISRNVHVVNDADFLVGTYNATPNCGATNVSSYVTNITTSNTVNNDIVLSKVLFRSNVLAKVINGDSIQIDNTVQNGIHYQGTGTINNGDFLLNFLSTYNNFNCSIQNDKQ